MHVDKFYGTCDMKPCASLWQMHVDALYGMCDIKLYVSIFRCTWIKKCSSTIIWNHANRRILNEGLLIEMSSFFSIYLELFRKDFPSIARINCIYLRFVTVIVRILQLRMTHMSKSYPPATSHTSWIFNDSVQGCCTRGEDIFWTCVGC